MHIPDFAAVFERTWQIERTILDRADGRLWRASGDARFVPIAAGVARYEESVFLSHESVELHASRVYIYRVITATSLQVDFENGSPFCHLAFVDRSATTTHLCREDEYRGGMTFESADRWRSHWTIRGPRKAIEIDTCYEGLP